MHNRGKVWPLARLAHPYVFLLVGFCFVLCSAAIQAQTVTVVNQLRNGYNFDPFPEHCPSGYTVSNIPSGYHIERPHAVYNSSTAQWVLWAHYDNSNYTTAEALVATSSTECGPYTIYSLFQPMGMQVRDDYLFEDSDGTAYFIAASNKNGGANDTLAIWQLTADYLSVNSSVGTIWVFENAYREAPIVFKSGSVYYLLTSQAAGWFPSQGGYATSSSMISGWSTLKNLGNASTFGGQESDIKIFSGSAGTAYILVLDHLGGNISRDDGQMWLPVIVDNTAQTASLEWQTAYQVNTSTGALTIPTLADLGTSTTTASSIGSGCHSYYATDQDYTTAWCASSASWPAWWQVDLGSSRAVGEIDTSWFMYKGSEGYYQYTIQYSNDGTNYTTIDRTGNQMYGFTSDQVNFTARYIKINLVNAVLQNNPTNWYTPEVWEIKLFAPNITPVTNSNYSFETPTTSTYVYDPTGASWTFSGHAGISTNGSGFTSGNPSAPDGSQVAFLQDTGYFSQTISGFTVGKTYTVKFSAAQRANKSGGQAGQTFNVLVNGTSVASFAPPQSATGYNDYSATFVATSTSNTIEFLGTDLNGGDNTIFIDNVRIWTPNL